MLQHKLGISVPGINQIHHFTRSGNHLWQFFQSPSGFAATHGSLHKIDCAGAQFVHMDCFWKVFCPLHISILLLISRKGNGRTTAETVMRPYMKRCITPRSFLLIYLLISWNYSRVAKLSSDQVFFVAGHRSGALFLASSFLFFFYIYFTSDFQ